MSPSLLLCVALLAAAPTAEEARVAERISLALVKAKRPAPLRDPAVMQAAHLLAERIAAGTLEPAAASGAAIEAMSQTGGWDPAPRVVVVSGSGGIDLGEHLAGQRALLDERAEVLGVGIATAGERTFEVAIASRRYAKVEPFPRRVPVGTTARFAAELLPPLATPKLAVTGPDGLPLKLGEVELDGRKAATELTFDRPGRWSLELVGRGPAGPTVAALFHVQVGDGASGSVPLAAEPADPMRKVEAVFARINALRAHAAVPPLQLDRDLSVLALDHAEDMATHDFFAHVSPTRGDLTARITGRAAFTLAGENLGEARGALAAQQAIEESPAHLQNLLDARFDHVGVALFPRNKGGVFSLVLVEIFTAAAKQEGDAAGAIHRVVTAERGRRGAGIAPRLPALDKLAADHLATVIRDGEPGGQRDLEDASVEEADLESVAVDLFVLNEADEVLKSANAVRPGWNVMGVAAKRVDSKRFGKQRLWVVVVYGRKLARRP